MRVSKQLQWRCSNCGALFYKDFAERLALYEQMVEAGALAGIRGTRTCTKCGTAHQVIDILFGKFDANRSASEVPPVAQPEPKAAPPGEATASAPVEDVPSQKEATVSPAAAEPEGRSAWRGWNWLGIALALFAGRQIGQVTLFWGNQARIGDQTSSDGLTPQMQALSDTLSKSRGLTFIAVVAALIATAGLPAEAGALRRIAVPAIVGIVAAAIGGYIIGYWNW
jgi:hypothetical protein